MNIPCELPTKKNHALLHRQPKRDGAPETMRAAGIKRKEMAQVVVMAVATLGMPSTVGACRWIRDILEPELG